MDAVRIHVPSELFAPAESSHFEGTFDLPVMKAGPDLHSFSEPLAWQVDVTNTGDAFLVAGTVEGEATTSCARCLDEFSFPVTGEIEGYYLIGSETEAPQDMDADEVFGHVEQSLDTLLGNVRRCRDRLNANSISVGR